MLRIKESICYKWKELGILLEIPTALILNWEMKYNRDSVECCNSVFIHWLDKNNPCKSYPRSWNGVYSLLQDVGFDQVAAELQEALDNVYP